MPTHNFSRRAGVFVAACLALTFGLSACSGAPSPSASAPGSAAPAASSAPAKVDAAKATSVADFGTLADLEAAAKAEGALNVIALPHDWANYGAIISAFQAKYPEIKIDEQNPNASSAEEVQAAKTNQGNDKAPDVFDMGYAVTVANTSMFAPYKVAAWADIPDTFKESTGLYTGDYGGYMSVGVQTKKVPLPTAIGDLLKPEYKGKVAINGDPTQAGAAFAAVGLATILNGGTVDDFTPGINYFADLKKAGNFIAVDPTPATIASGNTPVVFDWDYNNAAQEPKVPGWKTVVFPDQGYAGYYYQSINAGAPHPAAARLWLEFLYTDASQNMFLGGGARPVRMEAMTKAGTIDAKLAAALPAAPKTTVIPTTDQSSAASKLLGEKWADAVA